MIAELAHYALILAFTLAVMQTILPLWGAAKNDLTLMGVAEPLAIAGFGFITLSFAGLMVSFVRSDFSVLAVYSNSHSLQPLLYKITGVWGNHEGSMILWVFVLGFFSALVAIFGRNLPSRLKANVLGVEGGIAAVFLLFILTTSNPFLRLDPAPAEGQQLNPILQDIGLAIHPPLLYLGYVGFSITFAFAAAALIEGRVDAAWARWVRPWILIAWIFLTLGIAMGSYWAYYELGWGGYWFWDPVENASLMPWLAGTALLHSAIVMEKREALKVWTILLAILTFSLSLLGTFLVRSGVLTSVHSFANDPSRGVFILAILILFIGGSLTLFALRAPALKQGGLFAPISREGALDRQQSLADRDRRHGIHGHALSARAGSAHRRKNFRRRAVLRSDCGAAFTVSSAHHAGWAFARMEARGRSRRRRTAHIRGGDCRGHRGTGPVVRRRRATTCRSRTFLRGLRDHRRVDRIFRAIAAFPRSAWRLVFPCARIAALGIRDAVRAYRNWNFFARHCRGSGLESGKNHCFETR